MDEEEWDPTEWEDEHAGTEKSDDSFDDPLMAPPYDEDEQEDYSEGNFGPEGDPYSPSEDASEPFLDIELIDSPDCLSIEDSFSDNPFDHDDLENVSPEQGPYTNLNPMELSNAETRTSAGAEHYQENEVLEEPDFESLSYEQGLAYFNRKNMADGARTPDGEETEESRRIRRMPLSTPKFHGRPAADGNRAASCCTNSSTARAQDRQIRYSNGRPGDHRSTNCRANGLCAPTSRSGGKGTRLFRPSDRRFGFCATHR
ncbi:MAG: hypothetical protein JO108_18705 [Acidobacteriaceae bacterium]|nr:hypothetical protein [Acidobacteriaceae bacterium]